jgi:hypothetical protein
MLARFPLEIHAWTVPLLFATGYVIGYFHFRRKHPDLYAELERRRAARTAEREREALVGSAPEEKP